MSGPTTISTSTCSSPAYDAQDLDCDTTEGTCLGSGTPPAGVPPGSDYTTAHYGETSLEDVARRVGVDPRFLQEVNPQIKFPRALNAGDAVILPSCTKTAGKAPTGPSVSITPAGINTSTYVSPPRHVIVRAADDGKAVRAANAMSKGMSAPVVKLEPGALRGVREVTLVTHGTAKAGGLVEINGKLVTPEAAAQEMVRAGWDGGKVRLAACQGEVVYQGAETVAQRMANELTRLGSESVIAGPKGNVGASLKVSGGLPTVLELDSNLVKTGNAFPRGSGWGYVVAEDTVIAGSSPVAVPRTPPSPVLSGAAGVASKVTGVLGAVGMIKIAWDWAKMMEFGDSLRSGQYFQDFWMQVSALPDGAKVEMDGEIGTVDMSNGIAIHFKNADNDWTMKMVSDGKSGLGMHITGTDHGTMIDYHIDRSGVRGGKVNCGIEDNCA